jgi:2-polyprenyl-3-methyl-5-hydroxy-6-metoxy-1,4-benzoquinol methylase
MSSPSTAPTDRGAADELVEFSTKALQISDAGKLALGLDVPSWVEAGMEEADRLLREVEKVVRRGGVEVEYFEVSLKRYRHYIAACLSRPADSAVLEVGAAPGHVSIALHFAGFHPTGVNLNELWRATYPSADWFDRLEVLEHDVEKERLPFPDARFEIVLFTEILEHVAVSDPTIVLSDLRRVLVPGGLLILSTPNVCNISNILALARGINVFWPVDRFYGGLDRHNREYTPAEVRSVVEAAGFRILSLYGINADNNWRMGAEVMAYDVVSKLGDRHPLLRNTSVCLATR